MNKAEYSKNYSKNNRARMNRLRREWTARRREWFMSIKKGLRCVICSEDDSRCLDFHHKNPKEKSFDISLGYKTTANNQVILDEMKKCIVLCANCHRKIHSKV